MLRDVLKHIEICEMALEKSASLILLVTGFGEKMRARRVAFPSLK
jgi:hypothetical protein